MSSSNLSRPLRPAFHLRALCVLLCVSSSLALVACGKSDPLQEILRLQAQGDYQASIEPLRTLLAEHGDDPQIQYLYGRALVATGEPSLGEWALRNAAEDPDWLAPAGTQIAASALATTNYESAIEMATRVLAAHPDDLDVLLIRAQAYARSRRYPAEAIADADRILALDPLNTDAAGAKVLALLSLEKYEEAGAVIDEIGKIIEEQEDVSDATRGWYCATTAIFAADSEEADLARSRWNDCVKRFPGNPNVVGNAMKFFDDHGEYDRSLEILRGALEAEPASIDYRRRLAYRLRSMGDLEGAEAILVEGTEIAEPNVRPSAWQMLAKHYQDTGNHEKAVEAMRKAVEASRELGFVPAQLLFDYADALVLRRDFDEALAIADEMTVVPHQELIRARVAQERHDHYAALDHYHEAFRLWPDNPWARYLAAVSAEATGQFDEAIENYRYAIRIQPDATDARLHLARIHMAEGKLPEALTMLRLMADQSPLTLEEELLSVELFAWSGQQEDLARSLKRFAQIGPQWMGRALAAMGRGAVNRFGPEVTAQTLEHYGADGLEVQDPDDPAALRELLVLRAQAGTLDQLGPAVRAAVEARPDSAALRAVLGRWLELGGGTPAEARAAYDEALELDADEAEALAGIGRLVIGSDPAAALGWFDRATKAAPDEVAYGLGAVDALVTLGRRDEAITRLASLLEQHPRSVEAAEKLAGLQLEAGKTTEETQSLAQRAVRFGGGVDALDLLARVYRARDELQRATEVEARARALREATRPEAPPPA